MNRRFLGVIFGWLLLTTVQAQTQLETDEQTLRSHGLPTDAKGLLNFFVQRSLKEGDAKHLEALVRKLGSDVYGIREPAKKELIIRGPVALPFLRGALTNRPLEMKRRAELCIRARRRNRQAEVVEMRNFKTRQRGMTLAPRWRSGSERNRLLPPANLPDRFSSLGFPNVENIGQARRLEHAINKRIDMNQNEPASVGAQFQIERHHLAQDKARDESNLAEIEIEIGLAALLDQLEQILNENGNRVLVQIAVRERDQGAVLNVADFPRMGAKMERHEGTPFFTEGTSQNPHRT